MAAPDSIESTKNPFAQNTSTKKRHVSHKKSLLKKKIFSTLDWTSPHNLVKRFLKFIVNFMSLLRFLEIFILRLKLFEKIHIHKNVSRTLESVLSHCDPAYAVREKLTIEKPFVESALAIILWLKHEVNKEIGKNLFVNNGYNAQ